MIYSFAGRGLHISEENQSYAEKRFGHIERLLGRQKMEPRIEGEFEFHSGEDVKYVVRVNLDVGNIYHAEATGTTLHEAIDAAADDLSREAKKIKGRRLEIRRHASRLRDFLRGFSE